jgi:hypothetical protein
MAAKKKADATDAGLRKEHEFASDVDLQKSIDEYFSDCHGIELNEFSLAKHLGVTSKMLRRWKDDGEHPDRQFLVQSAYDRIADAVISDPAWNDKFMQQKSKQILESPIIAGYNTKVDVKSDNTVRVIFGAGGDQECMK